MENSRKTTVPKTDSKASVSYLNLIKTNLGLVLTISLIIFSISVVYAILSPDVYKSSTILKISQPQGKNILESPFEAAMGSSSTDRYIANEIEVMNNRTIREAVAQVVIDSFKQIGQIENFDIVLRKNSGLLDNSTPSVRSVRSLAAVFGKNVTVEQKDGLSFIEISVESASPSEAALVANCYADVYREFNLADSRKQLTTMKEFLASQRDEKLNELVIAEENLKVYQIQGGGVELNQQALNLIETTSRFEAKKNEVQIEMGMSRESLTQLQQELQRRDASVADFMVGQSAKPEIELLRQELALVRIQKTKALASPKATVNTESIIEQYDTRIANLSNKLDELVQDYRSKLMSTSPDELKTLTQEIFQAELKYETLKAEYNQLSQVVASYDREFNELPTKTLELARLERDRMSLEKLYTVLEAKYQEALINEQSTPGNVLIMSDARPPFGPSKPNRPLLAILGLFLGFGAAFTYIFLKDYFDKTVKTPDDIEKASASVLAWIPKFEQKIDKSRKHAEIFVGGSSEAAAGESFRTLRTRIQFSKIAEGGRSILITSCAPQEGKTTVACNLAASFAQSNKKTILLDCDMRIPRVNEVFGGVKSPGFTNYLFKQAAFDEILRTTDFENLYYIAAGTIPTNPSEILGSEQMREFIEKLKTEFDIVIIDSPPVMTITDAEVLSHIVDMSILVVFANKTEFDWLLESTTQLSGHGQNSFIGIVLNNFNYNSGYRSYNKYNHSKYYSRVDETKQKEWIQN